LGGGLMNRVKINNHKCFCEYEQTEFSPVFKIKSSNLLNIGYIYAKIRPYFDLNRNFINTKFLLNFYFFSFDEYEKNDLHIGKLIASYDDFEELTTVVLVVEKIFSLIKELDTLDKIKSEFFSYCKNLDIKCFGTWNLEQ
jgi:hypothetical protein